MKQYLKVTRAKPHAWPEVHLVDRGVSYAFKPVTRSVQLLGELIEHHEVLGYSAEDLYDALRAAKSIDTLTAMLTDYRRQRWGMRPWWAIQVAALMLKEGVV